MVEEGYVEGMDVIECPTAASNSLTVVWDKSGGLLHVNGEATLKTYAEVLSKCTFFTSSGDGKARRVTYAYGPASYSSATGHWYEYFHRGDQRAGLPYPNCQCPQNAGCNPPTRSAHGVTRRWSALTRHMNCWGLSDT